jgi:hypothetical protein
MDDKYKDVKNVLAAIDQIKPEEIAKASFALMVELLNTLEEKRILSPTDVKAVFAQAAAGLKTGAVPSMQAVKLLDSIAVARRPIER